MAVRPYILWDPGANATLHVPPGAGTLVVTGAEADRARWDALVAPWILPRHFADPIVGYANDVHAPGPAAPGGLRVRGYQFMPRGLSFLGADPLHREPRPFDLSDLWAGSSWPWIALGYRLGVRGYVGTRFAGLLNTTVAASWADTQARVPGEARGAWSGLAVTAVNLFRRRADHLASVCHGKRRGDFGWGYRAGYLDTPAAPIASAEAVVPWALPDGRVRIAVAGAPGAWDLTLQHWDPTVGPSGDWVTDLIQPADLWSHAPGEEDGVALCAALVPGATQWQPAAPSAWDAQELWFPDLELEQLEPWLIDVADWGCRDWAAAWAWLVAPGADWAQELRRPHTDLLHAPLGHPNGPIALRAFDGALGWHLELGADSVMATYPAHDLRGISATAGSTSAERVAVCDAAAFGADAPLAVVWRVRPRDLDLLAVGDRRALWASGRIDWPTPNFTSRNGIGVFVERTGASSWRFVARAYNRGGGWADAAATITAAELAARGDQPFDIAWAWTGARGARAGRPNRELRIVIDGSTAAAVPGIALWLNQGQAFQVGYQQPTLRGMACDLGAGAVFGEAVTDEEIAAAFTEVAGPFQNPSFEVASADGRPGEAEAWGWHSYQQAGAWAEFNAGDPALQAWQRAREDFAAGWEHNEDWVAAWALGEITAAVFNAGVPAFETTAEVFALWGRPDYLPGPLHVSPPWLDAWTLIAPPDELPTATGWTGWYDALFGGHALPLRSEQFREDWGTDPLSTAPGPWWYPGTGVGGRLRGAALAWPVTLPPERAWLWLANDAGEVYRAALTAGTYADAAALAAMVDAAIQAVVPVGSGLAVQAWSAGGASGLLFGWDGVTASAGMWALLRREIDPWGEARPYLGLASLGPWGTASEVLYPCAIASVLPPGVAASERLLLDAWALIDWAWWSDPVLGPMVLEYEQAGAVFDSLWDPPGTFLERCDLEGWTYPGATWRTAWAPGDLTPALFAGCPDPWQEIFDPAAWPLEPFPT